MWDQKDGQLGVFCTIMRTRVLIQTFILQTRFSGRISNPNPKKMETRGSLGLNVSCSRLEIIETQFQEGKKKTMPQGHASVYV